MPGVLWPPYTPLADESLNPPVEIVSDEGLHLITASGRRLIDGNSSWWCAVHGHRPKRIMDALHRQLDCLGHVSLAGLTHEPAARLSRELLKVAPRGFSKVFFSDNGSTAVETAIKLVWQSWRNRGQSRRLIVSFEGAYHGDTLGCMMAGFNPGFHAPFADLIPAAVRLPSPDQGPICIRALRSLLEDRSQDVAMILVEPLLQAAGGMRVHSPETLSEISKLCLKNDIPLIADEVATGFGRTGSLWAVDQADVRPDILCLSKALTGGVLPLGATLVSQEIAAAFESETFFHGHTFAGNPLAVTAAIESLGMCLEPSFLPKVGALSQAMKEGLRAFESLDSVTIRQCGVVGIVETHRRGVRPLMDYYHKMLEVGYYLRPLGSIAYFWPPLSMTPGECATMLEISRKILGGTP